VKKRRILEKCEKKFFNLNWGKWEKNKEGTSQRRPKKKGLIIMEEMG